MIRFLKNCCLFLLPFLLTIVLAEYLLRRIPNDYALKAGVYRTQAENIETLILGNSHAFYDLNPAFFAQRTFNGGHVAQSLDLDAAIFNKYADRFIHLKYVILPIADMSFFYKLGYSGEGDGAGESWRIKNYSLYYDLPIDYNIADHFEVLSLPFSINRNRLISWYIKKENNITTTQTGYGFNFNSASMLDLDSTALNLLKLHKVKDFKYFPEEKTALESIVSACLTKNISVVLFIAPAYKTYTSKIDSTQLQITLNTCNLLKNTYKNVRFLNLLNDTSFTKKDYFDADHLNEAGAKKLSLMIDSFIR